MLMMKSGFRLASIGCLGLSQLLSFTLLLRPSPAVAGSLQVAQSAAAQRLGQMFSPEIQATINACAEQGRVDLASGANPDGSVTCADGSTNPDISYSGYVDTISNILTASVLVGIKAAAASDPRVTPELLASFLLNSQGQEFLRSGIQTAITQNQLLPADATESVSLLTDAVVEKLTATLQTPSNLTTLLGTSEQYIQVVSNFCTSPGMSVPQTQAIVPLSPVQLYAICIQESGVTDEVLRMMN
jgi:hypothetical protein